MSISESVQRRLARACNDDEVLQVGTVNAQEQGEAHSIRATLSDGGTHWPDVEQGDALNVYYHPGTDSYVVQKADK